MRALAAAAACVLAEEMSPTEKVIQLLTNMATKGKQEMQDEEISFAKFEQFCKDESAARSKSIFRADEQIEDLETDIAEREADIDTLSKDVEKLNEKISKWDSEKTEANAERKTEYAEFLATQKDYAESLSALDRVLGVMKGSVDSDSAKEALVQVQQSSDVPMTVRTAFASLLAAGGEDEMALVDQATAISNPGQDKSSIINLVKGLKDKFQEEKGKLEKEEMNAAFQHKLLVQDLDQQMHNAQKQVDTKSKASQKTSSKKSAMEGELNDVSSGRKDDQEYLNDLTAECKMKKEDFASRQELRQGEIEAIEKAIDILGSKDVLGNEKKHRSLIQQAYSFLQLRAEAKRPINRKVAEFLDKQATALKSPAISELVTKISADPFSKVKQMIQEMLGRLIQEANEEEEHHGWCVKELATNAQIRDFKADDKESLSADIDEIESNIATRNNEIGDLSADVSDIDSSVAKATADREEEKEKNEETLSDAKAAVKAVRAALAVLKDFYKKAAQATALAQAPVEGQPETFDKPMQGQQDAAGGVMGLLDVILSDFSKLVTTTKNNEDSAQRDHDQYLVDAKRDKAVKNKAISHKEQEVKELESDLLNKKSEYKHAKEELESAEAYFAKLKPSCQTKTSTYEERVAQREKELEALKEALAMLSNGA